MNKKLLQEFVKVSEKLQALEEARDLLRAEIVADMRTENVEKAETDYGIFTRAFRTSWVYSKAVGALEEKVKVAKVREQNSGKAKASVTEFLRFTSTKEN